MSNAHPLEPGARLGPFEIGALLGRGGAGAVYRAAGPDGREVAVKVHAPLSGNDAGWRWRLRREFFLLAQLRHPHIVPVLDWGEHDDLLYYVMELVEGVDASRLAPLPADDVVEIVRAIAAALGLVHNHGLLHRDVKPNNVRLPLGPDGRPDPRRALLMDFGLLVRLDERSIDGSGTPGFIAPERLLGAPADERADLFGLGATAFALLTGATPSISRANAALRALPPGLPEGVPERLASLLGSLLAIDPRLRPRSAAEVVERLAPATGAMSVGPAEPQSFLASPPLVERDDALAGLRRAWAETLAGRGGPAFVVSGAGMGRSRLLHLFALELRVAGVRVAEARGEHGPPLELAVELVRRLSSDPSLSPVPAALDGREGLGGARLLATEREAIGFVLDAARSRPTALCIDDLDLADEASVSVIEALARGARGLPLLVLCSLRLDPSGESAGLARLRRSAIHVAVLERLGRAGVEQMLAGLFGADEATALLVDQLDHASGGNPAALLDLLEALVDAGRVALVEGRWRLPRQADDLDRLRPDELAAARAAELDAATRRVAELIALGPAPVELSVLARAAGLDERALLTALEELRERQLIRTRAGASVAIADAALSRRLLAVQSEVDRQAGHAALAAALRNRHGLPDLGEPERARVELAIGGHEIARGRDHAVEGAGWLLRGGGRLVDLGVFSEAIDPLRQGIALLEEAGGPDLHPELVSRWEQLGVASLMRDGSLSLGCFERLVGHLDRGGELSRIARAGRRFGTGLGGRLAVAGGVARAFGGRVVRGRWRAALALPSEADRYVRALAYLGVVEAQIALMDRARDHIDQLEAFARARGRDAAAVALVARAHAAFSLGAFADVDELTRAGLAVLDDKPGALDPEHARRARSSLVLMRAWVEALTAGPGFAAIDLAATAIDEMFEMHTFMLPAVFHAARGEIRLLLDARAALFARCFRLRSGWQEAFIYAPTAPALKDAGLVAQLRADVAMLHDLDVPPGPWREIIRRSVPALLCLAEEAWGRAAELAREAGQVARAQAGGSVLYLARALAAEAEAYIGMGLHAEADDRLRDVISMVEDPRHLDRPLAVRARLDRARAALAEADLDRAGVLLDEVDRQLGAVDLPGERAAHQHLAGERALAAGDLRAAAGHARAAQEAFVRLGNPLAAERALRLRRRSGDPAEEPPHAIGDPNVPAEGATVTMTGLPGGGDDANGSARGEDATGPTARGGDPTEVDDPARQLPRGR